MAGQLYMSPRTYRQKKTGNETTPKCIVYRNKSYLTPTYYYIFTYLCIYKYFTDRSFDDENGIKLAKLLVSNGWDHLEPDNSYFTPIDVARKMRATEVEIWMRNVIRNNRQKQKKSIRKK